MGTLLIVRHGQASWSADDYDVLSPLGWEQGRMLGVALAARGVHPDLVVRGDLRRHAETAESIADALGEASGWKGEAVVDARWNEFDHVEVLREHMPLMVGGGEPEPRQVQQWLQTAMARWTSGEFDDYTESFDAFAARTDSALSAAAGHATAGRTVLVVTSGGPIAWLSAALIGLGAGADRSAVGLADAWARLNTVVVNSSVTKVTVGAQGIRLVSFNEHNHLEDVTYR